MSYCAKKSLCSNTFSCLFFDDAFEKLLNVESVCTAFPTLLGPSTLNTHGLQLKAFWLYPSHDALQVPTLLGVVASVCTPLPTHTQQLPTLLAQQCWELLRPFARSLSNANLVASRHIKREKGSPPVDVRLSQTLLLKLPLPVEPTFESTLAGTLISEYY